MDPQPTRYFSPSGLNLAVSISGSISPKTGQLNRHCDYFNIRRQAEIESEDVQF